MGKVRINQGRSLPWTVRFLGVLVVFAIVIVITQSFREQIAVPLAIAASFLVPMIWFSNRILTIDTDIMEIHQGVWILGYRTGKSRSFDGIEKIYINKVKTSQTMHTRSNTSHTSYGYEFHAYMKLDEGEKIFLMSEKSEQKLEEKVNKIHKMLDIS